jgi:hypothetical protein
MMPEDVLADPDALASAGHLIEPEVDPAVHPHIIDIGRDLVEPRVTQDDLR